MFEKFTKAASGKGKNLKWKDKKTPSERLIDVIKKKISKPNLVVEWEPHGITTTEKKTAETLARDQKYAKAIADLRETAKAEREIRDKVRETWENIKDDFEHDD